MSEQNEQQLQADQFVSRGTKRKSPEQIGKQCGKTLIEDDKIDLRRTKFSSFEINPIPRRQKFVANERDSTPVNGIQQQPNQIHSNRIKSAAAE